MGLSVHGARSFEHAHIVTKWLRTMNLAIKGTEKSRYNRRSNDKMIAAQNALYKMKLIHAKTKMKS